MQVATSGAGLPPEIPGWLRRTPSVTTQKSRTPVTSNEMGAEDATNVLLGPLPPLKPTALSWYPLLLPLETTLSRMQAVVELGLQPVAGPPMLTRSGEYPTVG